MLVVFWLALMCLCLRRAGAHHLQGHGVPAVEGAGIVGRSPSRAHHLEVEGVIAGILLLARDLDQVASHLAFADRTLEHTNLAQRSR